MERSALEALFDSLARSGSRYLVVGGLAVLAHGYLRLTLDVDLVLDLDRPHPGPALQVFDELGFRPIVPVALADFADPASREFWVRQKQARVFQLFSDRYPTLRIDLFLEPPFDFEQAFARRHLADIAPGISVSFAGLDDLLSMKRAAGRPQDLADVAQLERLRRTPNQET